jgi:hypothetical protein
MANVLRGIGAVIAGFVGASVVMLVVETVNGHVLYPELGTMAQGVTDREVLRGMLASAPVGALLVVLVGWALGSLVGGFLAAWIGGDARVRLALILGVLLTLAGIANNLMLPPPGWFWIPTLLIFLPAAYAGAQLAPQRSSART